MSTRRRFLAGLLGAAAAVPLGAALGRVARALGPGATARRLVVLYFPDGIAGRSADGDPDLWTARAGAAGPELSELLAPLGPMSSRCVFLNGLSMGTTDEGSHPGGAKKLLTGVDGGHGQSIDQFLAGTVGRDTAHRHLYLGAMANAGGASGDKHISYPAAGLTTPPEDDPLVAFGRLFGGAATTPGIDDDAARDALREQSVIDTALADLDDLRSRLGHVERRKLDLHLEALREVEMRLAGLPPGGGAASCTEPSAPGAVAADRLYDPAHFPIILRAQMDLAVQAMACGVTRVGVIQASHHTSELIMSRFPDTSMYDPGFDMRSHQASHYGARHDRGNRLFTDFVKQRQWFVEQLRHLLEELESRPEDDGTMLDHTLVLFCTEVSDGNTHSHQDMPFVLAGRAGGCIETNRVLDYPGRRHGDLLATIAHAMGQPVGGFGDASTGPLPGLLA